MTWAKLDDSFPNHPKVLQAGPLAELIQVRAICYCCRYLTDGFLPASAVPTLLAGLDRIRITASDASEALVGLGHQADEIDWPALLMAHGLWEKGPDGYFVHDFLRFNPSKRSVERVRKERREAGRKGAKSRWGKPNRAMAERMTHAMAPAMDISMPPSSSSSSSPPTKTKAEAPPAPSWTAYLENLGADDREVLSRIPAAVASTRKGGRVAASVLEGLAREFARYPAGIVASAAQIYLDRGHAAEGKREPYLLGIVRREAQHASLNGNGQSGNGHAPGGVTKPIGLQLIERAAREQDAERGGR